ncbi:MAG: site-specific DNA-methyltransferase, partial [Bacilli bacterium]
MKLNILIPIGENKGRKYKISQAIFGGNMMKSESTNLSKLRRDKMLKTINEIKKNISDEGMLTNLSMIENELIKKKYGLIWEEHEERVDKELKNQIPTFEEDKEKGILSNPDDKFNFLLEGDNLHSLYLLEKTHKEKIDVIYIDPPYNTGNEDFVYNDKIIDGLDGYKHSKWLSFMEKRLRIAHELLSKEGVIFISIDDNEQAQLKLLCDQIFDDINNQGIIIVKSTPNARDYGHVGKTHEYVLMYSKNEQYTKTNMLSDKDKKFKYEDAKGPFNIHPLYNSNEAFTNENRPNLYYPFFLNTKSKDKNGFYEISLSKQEGWILIYPPKSLKNAVQFVWRWGKAKAKENINVEIIGYKTNGEYRIVQKMRNSKKIIRSILDDASFTTRRGTAEIEELFNHKKFNFPKPKELIKTLMRVATQNNSIVLDFFAGSGTTGHAILELNKEDGGNRKFILCTNNENNICQEITYERIKKVNNGYKDKEAISTNLKYYKTSYIPRINTEAENLHNNLLINIKNLIQLENGIEIDNNKIRVYLSEPELDKFCTNQEKINSCEKVYISSDILLTLEQEYILENNNIEVYIIPEYYFEDEIKEAM